MFLGITTLGWVLLALIIFPIECIGFIWLVRRVPHDGVTKKALFALLGLFLVLLPIGDAAWSALVLKNACPQAGLRVYRRVTVAGYFDEELGSGFLKGSGYTFREYFNSQKGGYFHAELQKDGKIETLKIDSPRARYHFTKWKSSRISAGVSRSERRIFDSLSGEVIARDIEFARYPGFIDRIWLMWFGPIGGFETCSLGRRPGIVGEIKNILIPINRS